MPFLNSLYREFVLGGHLLALGTVSAAAASAIVIHEAATPVLLVMAYLFSYGAYMMNRTAEIDQDLTSHPERTALMSRRKRYLPLISGGCFILGYVLAATVNLVFFAALLVPLALSVLYSVGSKKLVGVFGVSKLKDKLLVKNLVVSLGWSLIPLLVGLYYLNFALPLWFLSGLIFLRGMSSTMFFDIRDVDGDREQGIKTVPVAFGAEATYKAMTALNVVGLLYVAASVVTGELPQFALTLAALPLYSMGYTFFARRPGANLNFICDNVADAEDLFWGPLVYVGAALV